MKSYTDLEQSKKLAEILPIESADMKWFFWKSEIGTPKIPTFGYIKDVAESYKNTEAVYLPCWSLAALLEVIGVECRMEKTPLDQSGEFTYSFVDDYYNIRTFEEDNAVNAAVEMIYKLKEKNLL